MMQLLSRRFYIALLVIILASAVPMAAQEEGTDPATLEVQVGYDGNYRGEAWMPVTVTASNEGQPIDGELRITVPAGGDSVLYNQPINLPTQSNKRVILYVYTPDFVDRLQVRLLDGSGRVVTEAESDSLNRVNADALLYGVVSDQPGTWTFLEQVTADRPQATVSLLAPEHLPAMGSAWNSLDVVILNNVDTGRFGEQQLDALESWLGNGGRLVVTGGPGWQQTTAGVAHLLPVTVDGTRSVDDLPSLRGRAGVSFRDPGPYVVATSSLRSGTVLFQEENLPLFARREHGRGAVYFLALDPTLAPLLDWQGREVLWTPVAAGVPQLPPWAGGPQNAYAAAEALTSLPSLRLPSALWLCLFLFLYVGIVGPVNYLFLKRLKRRELAWLTIPGVILLFSVLAYVAGFRLRGNDVIFNEMSVAYGNLDSAQMRVSSLLGVYSPRRATYDVTVSAGALVRPFDRTFSQLTGSGNQRAITQGDGVTLTDLRVDVGGVETYAADSYRPLPALDGRAALRLEGSATFLDVNVQNNGQHTLANAGLMLGGTFVTLGDLQPGAGVSESRRLTTAQTTSMTGSGSAPASIAPLSAHYEQLLGTPDFFADADVQARYQLLESLQNFSGSPRSVSGASWQGVTLVGWSEVPQLDVALADERHSVQRQATTLYFLDFPLENVVAAGEGVGVPPSLLSRRVLSERGVSPSSASDFYLSPGWIELAFEPWPAFHQMDVTELQIVLTGSGTSGAPPAVRLWNWQEEAWTPVPNAVWGNMGIGNFAPFIGEQNEVRIRLENNSTGGMTIGQVYPALTGDVE